MKNRGLQRKKQDLIKALRDSAHAKGLLASVPSGAEASSSGPPEQKLEARLLLRAQELELQKYQLELAEKEAQHKHKLKAEQREAQHQHEHELKVLRLQHGDGAGANPAQPLPAAQPRVHTQNFTPCKVRDNPEVFLSAFKKQADRWGVKEEDCPKHVAWLVSGSLATVLDSLLARSENNYSSFTKALFERFRLGSSHFQKRFSWTEVIVGGRPHIREVDTGVSVTD
ncbi:uncharacterized protein LOC112548463 [Alligator sinensis]|uniref:Uncharacterized protein LOC112548463 n=1 Tax=Alligator sinensis TaxID=38654 RepID=A0A3Q0FS42_ALLSI|nr:uncharacterized protein LOC112548463 [Alligator sinensis]